MQKELKKPGALNAGALLSSTAKGQQSKILELLQTLKSEDAQVMADFQKNEAHIKEHHLAQVILDRHNAAVAQFTQRSQDFQGKFLALATTLDPKDADAKTQVLLKQLDDWKPLKPKFDPKNLPFRTNDNKIRLPATTPEGLKKILSKPLTLAAKPTAEQIAAALPPEQRKQKISNYELAEINADEHPYELDRGKVEVAGLGMVSTIPPPGPEYLAPTEDVQITPEIEAKAAELHHNPVEIYNWVHNNIEWLPSYGSIQGSQMTLDKLQGNAFDTASLLISLLRTSGIPARYVYGTVDVPVDKMQNWVGGTTNPDAAQNILGQGGIPNVGLTKGGQTVAIRMEHVWVEAWVDFYPSRGSRNIQGDTWVPLEAAFKQYTYANGVDLDHNVPSSQPMIDSMGDGAIVDTQAGSVQHINVSNTSDQLEAYFEQVGSYLSQHGDSITVGEALGRKIIVPTEGNNLVATLPFRLVVDGEKYGALPDNFRHYFYYNLFVNEAAISSENPALTFRDSAPSLAGKSISLFFEPYSQSDQNYIDSFFPPHADGSKYQLSDLPTSYPSYAVRFKAQIRVDGHVVSESRELELGSELIGEGGFTNMNLVGLDLSKDTHIVGASGALQISLQGISEPSYRRVLNRLHESNEILKEGQLAGLNDELLVGDNLRAGISAYFMSLDGAGSVFKRRTKVEDIPGLSYGFFRAQVDPKRQYGMVTQITGAGLLMDVGHIRRICYAEDNNHQSWVTYNKLRGMYSSAMENWVPEQFFNNSGTQKTSGYSAIKLLALANQQGQKIYTLTSNNRDQLENIHQSPSVKNFIGEAIDSGMEVIIHSDPITVSGFHGAGYIVHDPSTGSGAYLVEGGFSGAAFGLLTILFTLGILAICFCGVGVAVAVFEAWIFEVFTAWELAGAVFTGAMIAKDGAEMYYDCNFASGINHLMGNIAIMGFLAVFELSALKEIPIKIGIALDLIIDQTKPDAC